MSTTERSSTFLLKELEKIGCNYHDIHDIFKQEKVPLNAVNIILKWLPDIYAEHLGAGDQLVRSLISAEEPFDPSILIELFENGDYNFSIKGGIAIVLSSALTYDISSWIRDQLLNKPYALERVGLIPGLAKKGAFKTSEALIEFLELIFDKYAGDWLFDEYKKYANENRIDFLLDKINTSDSKLKKSITKLITAIQKRKKIYRFPPSVNK